MTQAFDSEVEISVEDFKKLESGEIDMYTITEKYPDIDYLNSEIAAYGEIESLEYIGEVLNETV